jgi:hypothetical protein
MAKPVRASESELEKYKSDRALKTKIEYLSDKIENTNDKVVKVVIRWDWIMKIIGAIVSVMFTVWAYIITNEAYARTHKPSFIVAIGIVVLFLVFLFLVNMLIWLIVDMLHINKMMIKEN